MTNKQPDGTLNWKAQHVQGSSRKMRLRDTRTAVEKRQDFAEIGRFNPRAAKSIVERMLNDPVYKAEIEHALRKPVNVDRFKHGAAGRAAAGIPMLNASKDSIAQGLNYREHGHKDNKPKGALFGRIVVKPTSVATAKLDHPGGFWGERTWSIYNLKYAPGVVAVTDHGKQTASFPTVGELMAAIGKSGWEVTRDA